MQNENQIITYIRKHNILDEKTLEEAINQQASSGENLISVLKKNRLAGEKQLSMIIAASNKIKFINLSPDMIDPMAAHMVPHEIACQQNLIPIEKDGQNLIIAMASPLNLAARNQIEARTGYKVCPVAATPTAIQRAIKFHFNVLNVTKQAIASMRLKNNGESEKTDKPEIEFAPSKATDDPITKLVSSIITGAIDAKASDIHIEPQVPDMQVRYRIDGICHNAVEVPSSAEPEVVSHIKILAEMDISEHRMPQDGHISLKHEGREYDLRVSSLPAIGGEKIVIRILDKSSNRWSLDSIVTSQEDKERFKSLAQNPYGMFLLTGPTGSGKTTTLYSILQLLNMPEKNIVTVEDPVEYRLDGITQVQVKPSAGMTFASALRSILRQDPDIILIGEIRDLETAEIAISAALTGHFVLSTLHTNDAVGAISRLVNLGIPPFLVASAVIGSAAQRLIRTTCTKCRQTYQPGPDELNLLKLSGDENNDIQFYKGAGCDNCMKTGYSGRKAIYEILPVSADIRKLIVNSCSDDAIKELAITESMRTLQKSAIDEVLNGSTTFEELLRVVDMRA